MERKDDAGRGSLDGRLERAKDAALGAHRGGPSVGDEIGEAVGGISGVLLGAGIGTAAGPLGTLIGGIAGAIGGWWGGRAVAEAAESLTSDDESHYRAHYRRCSDCDDEAKYERARAAYYVGHLASHNPEYAGRTFDEIESELRRGWPDGDERCDEWPRVRAFAEEGYRRGCDRRAARRPEPDRRRTPQPAE